eukprot:scaffold64966_cov65-Phaeocystis_antarctica.AAC.1
MTYYHRKLEAITSLEINSLRLVRLERQDRRRSRVADKQRSLTSAHCLTSAGAWGARRLRQHERVDCQSQRSRPRAGRSAGGHARHDLGHAPLLDERAGERARLAQVLAQLPEGLVVLEGVARQARHRDALRAVSRVLRDSEPASDGVDLGVEHKDLALLVAAYVQLVRGAHRLQGILQPLRQVLGLQDQVVPTQTLDRLRRRGDHVGLPLGAGDGEIQVYLVDGRLRSHGGVEHL